MKLHVEFIGLPGAGKSTLSNELISFLTKKGLKAMDSKQGLDVCLYRTIKKERTKKYYLKKVIYNKFVRRFWPPFIYTKEQVASYNDFITNNFEYYCYTIKVLKQRSLSLNEGSMVNVFLFESFSCYQLCQDNFNNREILVLDEGFCHRALAIWGRGVTRIIDEDVVEYAKKIPNLDILVVVESTVSNCISRMDSRGYPLLLRDLNPEEKVIKLNDLQRVIMLISEELKKTGVIIVSVDNNSDLSNSMGVLKSSINEILCSKRF